MHPGRRLRLNLRRVELASSAMVFDAAIEGIFSHFRNSPGLAALAVLVIFSGAAFIWTARRPQQEEQIRLVWRGCTPKCLRKSGA